MSSLSPGDPIPWFHCRTPGAESYPFSTAAGRLVVITYLGSASVPAARQVMEGFYQHADTFDGQRALHFAVSCDPRDELDGRLSNQGPGYWILWDFDRRVAQIVGAYVAPPGGAPRLRAVSVVLDPALRVLGVFWISHPERHVEEVCRLLDASAPAPPGPLAGVGFAPALILPRVLEPELCQALIRYYDAGAPEPTGVLFNHPDGSGQIIIDPHKKTRRDVKIEDPELLGAVHQRVERRVMPEVRRAFQFPATRIERYVVGCYDASERGWFSAHRDNQGRGTAHRKFACSLNLNAADYEGGDLSFPEYGLQRYRPPTGGCVVFSCALLHQVDPVTRGRRLCVLPFFFDEEGEQLRLKNQG